MGAVGHLISCPMQSRPLVLNLLPSGLRLRQIQIQPHRLSTPPGIILCLSRLLKCTLLNQIASRCPSPFRVTCPTSYYHWGPNLIWPRNALISGQHVRGIVHWQLPVSHGPGPPLPALSPQDLYLRGILPNHFIRHCPERGVGHHDCA